MKTNIRKIIATGVVATVALVVSYSIARATAITGWGFEPTVVSGCTVTEYGSLGAFDYNGPPTGNSAVKAVLPQAYLVHNIGDKLTFTCNVTFTNGTIGGDVWRFFLGTTNPGVDSMGVLTATNSANGLWMWEGSGQAGKQSTGYIGPGAYYLGYNMNFIGAQNAPARFLAKQNMFYSPITGGKVWYSTSSNVQLLAQAPFPFGWSSQNPAGAGASVYHILISFQKAEQNVMVALIASITTSGSPTESVTWLMTVIHIRITAFYMTTAILACNRRRRRWRPSGLT